MPRRLALLLVALATAACSGPKSGPLGAAPAFDLPAAGGGRISLASLQGKVVVLDFWATWCTPCLVEIPDYREFWHKNRARGVELVGVVVDSGEPEEIRAFLREEKVEWPQALGDDEISLAYGATDGLPTTFVIDQQGTIRRKMLGIGPEKMKTLQRTVDEALASAAR